MSATPWVRIGDTRVRHLWRCRRCRTTASVSPAAYSDIGTPVCGDCDTDLVYLGTEIDLTRIMKDVARRGRKRNQERKSEVVNPRL